MHDVRPVRVGAVGERRGNELPSVRLQLVDDGHLGAGAAAAAAPYAAAGRHRRCRAAADVHRPVAARRLAQVGERLVGQRQREQHDALAGQHEAAVLQVGGQAARRVRVEAVEVGCLLEVEHLEVAAAARRRHRPVAVGGGAQLAHGDAQRRNLVEVGLRLQQVEVGVAARQAEARGAQEVQHVPEGGAVAVDEVVAVAVARRRRPEAAAEHGAEHRVGVARERGARRRVHDAAHVQRHHLAAAPIVVVVAVEPR